MLPTSTEAHVKLLHEALTQPSSARYEKLRKEFIAVMGYERFFELQHEAFLQIASNA